MKKSIIAIVLCLALLALPFCALAEDAKTVYILTPTEDHGWTGSVATFAKMSAEEINNAGTYKAEVVTAGDPAEQITQIEDIVANEAANVAGVVILPQDNTLEFAIRQLVDAKIPYVAFDRIIDEVKDDAVANVSGDNTGVGVAVAAYFVEQGMKPGDEVVVFEGDTSSVTTNRDDGFKSYLLAGRSTPCSRRAWARSSTLSSIRSASSYSAGALRARRRRRWPGRSWRLSWL